MSIILILLGNLFACDQLIEGQLGLIRQPRHPVKVNILLTIYQDVGKVSYFGTLSQYLDNGLQSPRLWQESCTPVDNRPSLFITPTTLTLINGSEVNSFSIHCDGDFIIGRSKDQKMVATFEYEYNIN